MNQNIDYSNPEQLAVIMQTMSQQLEQLARENFHLQRLVQDRTPTPRPVERTREPSIDLPAKFSGKPKELRNFLVAVDNVFEMQYLSYDSDRRKTGLIGSLCSEDALNWYRTLQESQSVLLHDYESFVSDMKEHFGDPHVTERAKRELLILNQGKGSASGYASRFRRCATDTGFNNETLVYHFERGLKSEVRKAIAVNDRSFGSLEDLIKYAIKVDNRLFEASNSILNNDTQFFQQRNTRDPNAMEIGSLKFGKIDENEKRRRYDNKLCLYCGESGHRVNECNKKPASKTFLGQVHSKN